MLLLAALVCVGTGSIGGCGSDGEVGISLPPPPTSSPIPTLTPPGAARVDGLVAPTPTATPLQESRGRTASGAEMSFASAVFHGRSRGEMARWTG